MTIRLLICIGTRPEAIKLASLINYLKTRANGEIETSVCSTGQHAKLLSMTLQDLVITLDASSEPPNRQRDIATLLQEVIKNVSEHIARLKPDLVLVQGDTTSALGSALAAFSAGIPTCHLEAGLRSFRQWEPFPEELNRRTLSRLASFHFATTPIARANLLQDGTEPARIFLIRNPAFDMLDETIESNHLSRNESNAHNESTILVTLHRREDREIRIQALTAAVHQLTRKRPELSWVFVWHPSLNIHSREFDNLRSHAGFQIIEPLPYSDFIGLLAKCNVVVTDSGGVSEEAGYLGIPLVVFRRITEREDLAQSGIGVPVGANVSGVVEGILSSIDNEWSGFIRTPSRVPAGPIIGRILIDIVAPSLGDVEKRDLR